MNLHWNFDGIFPKKVGNCFLINFSKIFDSTGKNAGCSNIDRFVFTSFLENRSYICRFQDRGKLRNLYCIIVKNANVFHEEIDIFFQYFNRNLIILNRFLFAEVFDFPNTIDLFNSTERKRASFIRIFYCCNARVVFCIPLLILM